MHESGSGGEAAGMDRRGFVGWAGLALAGAVAVASGVVAIVYAAAPALRAGKGASADRAWSEVPDAAAAADAPARHVVKVVSDAGWAETQATHAVFLDRGADGRPVAFSARCPHEGCQVDWRGEQNRFVCPCHNSQWTRVGARLAGPTKRGLDPLDVREGADGRVEVRYATFALDSAERIPVG
jgi:Rieske Fe-S protein